MASNSDDPSMVERVVTIVTGDGGILSRSWTTDRDGPPMTVVTPGGSVVVYFPDDTIQMHSSPGAYLDSKGGGFFINVSPTIPSGIELYLRTQPPPSEPESIAFDTLEMMKPFFEEVRELDSLCDWIQKSNNPHNLSGLKQDLQEYIDRVTLFESNYGRIPYEINETKAVAEVALEHANLP